MKLSHINELDGYTAVLGGSFDPIHLGHVHIARQILLRSSIVRVLFVPNGNHHFKGDQIRLSFEERFSLVAKAIAGEPRIAISDADQQGSGYTAHLMQRLFKENPGTRYAFVIGADNLPNLNKWYDFAWLSANLHFLIIPRPDYEINPESVPAIKASLVPIELSPVSSTDIRKRIERSESIHGLVPDNLEAEIIRLYKA